MNRVPVGSLCLFAKDVGVKETRQAVGVRLKTLLLTKLQMETITLAQLKEWIARKESLRTIGQFKELARQFRDTFGLTDRQALDLLNKRF